MSNQKGSLVAIVIIVIALLLGATMYYSLHATSGILITSPAQNEIVKFPFDITGSVNDNGWVLNGNSVGFVQVFDGNGKSVSHLITLRASTDPNTLPVQFQTNLSNQQLTSDITTINGALRFTSNIQPDGVSQKIFELPIRFR